MGHLTRQLCVALAGRGELDVTVLSLSGALGTVARAAADGRLPGAGRFRFEYCPSRTSAWQGRGAALVAWRLGWDAYFADRLSALVAETGARVVAYDGVVPYAGLLAARRALPEVGFVWIRRGMWRAGVGAQWLARADHFDLVIEPGDFAGVEVGPTARAVDVMRTAPVSLLSQVPAFSPERARAELGLDPDRPALLLAPGSGAYADPSTLVENVLAAFREAAPDWQIALTRQAIARPSDPVAHAADASDGRLVLLREVYPLARSLRAFDAAVGAAGYNTVHENLAVALPTLLTPSTAHQTDDQVARARALAESGTALVAQTPEDLTGGILRLLQPSARAEITAACTALPRPDGASAIASTLVEIGRGRSAAPWSRRFGPRAHRRLLARTAGSGRGTPVVTDDLDVVDARGERPVEHVLAHGSQRYRDARRDAAGHLYPASR